MSSGPTTTVWGSVGVGVSLSLENGGGRGERDERGDLSSQVSNGLQLNPMAKEFVPTQNGVNGQHMYKMQQTTAAAAAGGKEQHGHGHGHGRSHRYNNRGRGSNRYHHQSNGRKHNTHTGKGSSSDSSDSQHQRANGHGRGRGSGGSHRGGAHKKGSGNQNYNNSQRTNEDQIKRTVYICDIDQQVTEAQLAAVFIDIGPIVDCRVCGDPNSAMRFAFIEFEDEISAKNALVKNGTVLGLYNLRVLPSRTAIVPVNLQYLPQSYVEREQCGRTVYVANIDKKVDRNDVRAFFETLCGRVSKLRLLGDYQHATRIAFIEFFKAESAIAALNCSGALLGSLPIRVSPSKTPVRPDPVRAPPSSEGGEGSEETKEEEASSTEAVAAADVTENATTATHEKENGDTNTKGTDTTPDNGASPTPTSGGAATEEAASA